MTGEPAHITSKERMVPELMFLSERAPQLSVESEVAITLRYQLCSATITQCYKQKTAGEAPLQSIQLPQKIQMIRTSPNYQLLTRK